jgi:hypothetical protein
VSGSQWVLTVSVLLACAVEGADALKIVLAIGTTRVGLVAWLRPAARVPLEQLQ